MTDAAREAWLATLDPGIAPYVDILDAGGIDTFESCEGGDGHAVPDPMVRFHGASAEGFKALALALGARLPVVNLRRFWQVVDGEPCGPYWELSFRATAGRSASTAAGRRCR
jgi:hypothetical protein